MVIRFMYVDEEKEEILQEPFTCCHSKHSALPCDWSWAGVVRGEECAHGEDPSGKHLSPNPQTWFSSSR